MVRDFAERLIAYETTTTNSSESKIPAACRASEKLRPQLATLIGNMGFQTLLSRALALAIVDVPWLHEVHVKTDGTLEGLEGLGVQVDPDKLFQGCVVLLTHLLGLLVAFIGEGLTLRLVHQVWPELSFNDLDLGKGDKNEKAK